MNDIFKTEYSNDEKLKARANEIKRLAQQLHDIIVSMDKSREQALAITKLEECVMWAVKGVYK